MRKTQLRQKKVFFPLALGLLVLIGYFFSDSLGLRFNPREVLKQQAAVTDNCDYSSILVSRVVDGDTLKLENGKYLRLLGIDTPEIHESAKLHRDALRSKQSEDVIKQLGRQSYEFTKQLVEGKRVRLEFDAQKYDKYNRMLAYVFLDDGTFLNARIVEEGYASLMTYPPNVKYVDLFTKLYRQARENKRGLWK